MIERLVVQEDVENDYEWIHKPPRKCLKVIAVIISQLRDAE